MLLKEISEDIFKERCKENILEILFRFFRRPAQQRRREKTQRGLFFIIFPHFLCLTHISLILSSLFSNSTHTRQLQLRDQKKKKGEEEKEGFL